VLEFEFLLGGAYEHLNGLGGRKEKFFPTYHLLSTTYYLPPT
jgi:hypothetical protein